MAAMPDRAETLFTTAMALASPAERAAFLDRECAGDSALRDHIEAQLRAHKKEHHFSDRPVDGHAGPTADYVPSNEQPGTIIGGRYKLLQPIGEGGMGSVWLAEQTEPVKRRVAVKLIRVDKGQSKAILSRFAVEQQAIALMDHPHIAKLLDAGTTDDGSPFFVMELVKGLPLTEHCDAQKLSIPERLQLFMQICAAVQHAHQKGVIHRDLKPTNILVESREGKPAPKVIDFGLAKATSGLRLTDHTLFTAFGSVMGTPLYMAPEQANFNAVDVDTRADIYALGVILYELLTGTTPLAREKVKEAALDEMLKLIREQEAPTPSSRLSSADNAPSVAANRRMEPAKLSRLVKGELDWIVLKALAKERDRRYETPNGFAEDIERFLNREPVLAGPPGLGYRVRKFVQRNRGKVIATAGGLIVSLVGLGAIAAVQRSANLTLAAKNDELTKANERVTEANAALEAANTKVRAQYSLAVDAIKTYHTGVSEDFLLKEEKFKDLRDRLLNSASEFYGKLGALLDQETDLGSRRALAQANAEVANLTAAVGRKEDALAAHRKVLAARERLAAKPEADAATRADVGLSLTSVASLLQAIGRTEEALATYRKAESLLGQLVDSPPHDMVIRMALARCRAGLGWLLYTTGKATEGLQALRQAQADQELLGTATGSTLAARRDLSETMSSIGRLLFETGRPTDGEAEYRKALAIREKLVAENPAAADLRSVLAQSHNNLGFQLALTGRSHLAEIEHRKALAIRQKLVAENPAVTDFRKLEGHSHHNLGLLYLESGRLSDADGEIRKALALYQKIVDDNPAVTEVRINLADVHHLLAMELHQVGRLPEAEAEFRSGLRIFQKLANDNPTVTVYRIRLVDSHIGVGDVLQASGKLAGATAENRQALLLCRKLVADNPTITDFRSRLCLSLANLGNTLLGTDQLVEAEVVHREALTLSKKLVEDNPAMSQFQELLGVSYSNLGELLARTGRAKEAEAEYQQAQTVLQRLVDANPRAIDCCVLLAKTLAGRGDVNQRFGRAAEARKFYSQAINMHEALVKENPKNASYCSALASLLLRRGLVLLRDQGKAAGAVADTRRALELFDALESRTGAEWFETACCHATLSALAGRHGSGIPAADGPAAATKAIELLKTAIKKDHCNPQTYRNEKALDALCDREDFKKLLSDLDAKAAAKKDSVPQLNTEKR
jgi:tetratricopeptide (TPR) repeat protein/tRNA A-37 threonylcarbamoyl transferase component Bud32